jgi:hypothetical protein
VKRSVFVDTDVALDLLARREPFYIHAALAAEVPVFVTRNVRHYRKSAIRVCTAEEYLALTGA